MELASFAGGFPLVDSRQPPPNITAIRRSFVEIHQDDGIVLSTGGVAAIGPVLRRRMARCKNELQVFAVGDFTGIQCRGGDQIKRQEKR